MNVCYFGAFKSNYARNDLLRRSLELAGCPVVLCKVPKQWPTYRKYVGLTSQYLRRWRQCDVIVVAEFGQSVMPLAWALGRMTRRPVACDMVIGLHESVVIERGTFRPDEPSAKNLFWLDKQAGDLADGILTGTSAYREYVISEFGFPASKVYLAPLGVNDAIFHPLPRSTPPGDKLIVLYFGSFIPNHGVDVIVQAAAQLQSEGRFLFRFIGDGRDKPGAMEMAARLGLNNVEFLPPVRFDALPACVADADIVLGVFGDTPQANKAMANKVLQGLAMQKPVISGDTIATRENFEHGQHLWLCPLGDVQALANGLHTLAADEALRRWLAEQGYRRVVERLTPEAVGQQLKSDLAGLITRRQ